ncbi:MAG: hypothetical protein LBM98_01625 [Oscillospiraceae bacterium]|nr:hypothetical protein [Oscillospiraceae bacterium]
MLRTCNVLRIVGVPVLRKDGARRRDGGRCAVTAHHGQGVALPPRTARGNHPAACGRHPSQEGNLRGRAGLKPAPTWLVPQSQPAPNSRPNPRL